MLELTFLGTANAVPDQNHNNTSMVVASQTRLLLIDCPENHLVILKKNGFDVLQISDIVLTHFHPDHVAGTPGLLMQSWLLGRSAHLNIYAIAPVLQRLETMLELYEWHTWPGMYPVEMHTIPQTERVSVIEDQDFRLYASPVQHIIPNIGLRIESPATGRTVAYSSDTEPCQSVVRLATQVDTLIHEASGLYTGHSTANQAGEIAMAAQAKSLMLVHYNPRHPTPQQLVEEARQKFPGPVRLAYDGMKFTF